MSVPLDFDEEMKQSKVKFKAILQSFLDALDPLITRKVGEHPLAVNVAMELTAAAYAQTFKRLEDEAENESQPDEEESEAGEGDS